MFCKVLEQVIACLGAAITKNPHFPPKKGQKMPFFLPKTVFLGPEWSDPPPPILRVLHSEKHVLQGFGAS